MADDHDAMLTLSQIADLARTKPSAVSNWRRRFPDFPRPVQAGASGRDLYALAEVEEWLRRHDRLPATFRYESLLFTAMDLVRGVAPSDEATELVAAAIALLEVASRRDRSVGNPAAVIRELEQDDEKLEGVFSGLADLDRKVAVSLTRVLGSLARSDRHAAFESVLASRHRFVETRTNDLLADLLVRLGGTGRTFFDPAAGEGGLLAHAADAAETRASLFGQEINLRAWRIARQRFLLRGITAEIVLGDSILDDAFGNITASVVLCDPPYGMANPLRLHASTAASRPLSLVQAKTADSVWLDIALRHTSPSGRAVVVLPQAVLRRPGPDAAYRTELLRRGDVEAVIALPGGTAERTGIPLAVWLLRHSSTGDPPSVLVADAAANGNGLTGEALVSWAMALTNTWRRSGKVNRQDGDRAVGVPVLDLVSSDADLSPVRWIRPRTTTNWKAARTELSEALGQFESARGRLTNILESTSPPAAQVRWEPIGDLINAGVATIIRGTRLSADDCGSQGVRAIRTKDMSGEKLGSSSDPCFVQLASLRPTPTLTEPGDIVVSPASGRLRAMVDNEGGNVLVHPVQALRLRVGWLDARAAAAFVESPRNRRFATGLSYGYARVDLRELELPALPPAQAGQIRS